MECSEFVTVEMERFNFKSILMIQFLSKSSSPYFLKRLYHAIFHSKFRKSYHYAHSKTV